MNRKWFEIKNEAEDKAEVWIYDLIGEDFWGGISAKSFIDELNEIKASNIDLHINSPGGLVRDGQAIHNAIARHPAKVTTYVDGLAASIASTVALAGDEVIMADNSLMMIHSAWAFTMGNAKETHHNADVLEKHDQTIQGIYQRKTGKDLSEIQDAMEAETWFTADEAVEFGLADRVEEGLQAAACLVTPEVMARFKNPPEILKQSDLISAQEAGDRLLDEANRKSKVVHGPSASQLSEVVDEEPEPKNPLIAASIEGPDGKQIALTIHHSDGTTSNDLPDDIVLQPAGAAVKDDGASSEKEPIDLAYELIEHRRKK